MRAPSTFAQHVLTIIKMVITVNASYYAAAIMDSFSEKEFEINFPLEILRILAFCICGWQY